MKRARRCGSPPQRSSRRLATAELRQKVAVAGVKMNTIEASPFRSLPRGRGIRNDFLYVRIRHFRRSARGDGIRHDGRRQGDDIGDQRLAGVISKVEVG